MEVPNGVLDKLARLIKLSERPGTLAEAEAASRAMQRLLTRHQLTLLEAERLVNGTRAAEYTTELYDVGAHSTWRRLLLNGIATQNFCRCVGTWESTTVHVKNSRGQRQGTKFHLIGRPQNLAAVLRLYEYLSLTIERLAADYIAAAKTLPRNRYVANFKGIGNDFRSGAVVGIVSKLFETRTATVADAGMTALVAVEDSQLDDAVRAKLGTVRAIPGRSLTQVSHSQAFRDGMIAGHRIGLEEQVAAGKAMAGLAAERVA